MAKFLTTNGNVNYIEELIKDAKSSLTLVTPYLSLTKNFINRLTDADLEGIKITLIYGKEPMKDAEKKKLYSLKNLEVYFCADLHAKCYHNHEKLIITSMNLYEFSEKINREMGVLFDSVDDSDIFKEALKEIKSISNNSVKEKSFTEKIKEVELNSTSKELNAPNAFSTKIPVEKNHTFSKYHSEFKFFYPSLSLKLINSGLDTVFDLECLTVNSLQYLGVNITIMGRLDFVFKNEELFDQFKEKNKSIVKERLGSFRFFWNYNQIDIYFPKKYNVIVDEQHLVEITNNYFLAIKSIVELI